MMDLGLLLVRVVVGGLLAAHGMRKLTGWFGGPGLDGNTAFLRQLGYRRPRGMAWLHGIAETAAGVLLVMGMLTPLAVAAVVAVMLNAAVAVHVRNGLWAQRGGYEYPLVLGVVAAGLALAGPGRFSVDAFAGWDVAGWWALVSIAAGLLTGTMTLTARRSTADDEERQADHPASGRPRTPAAA